MIEDFLHRNVVASPQDIEIQLQLWCYMVAKHFQISLKEVHEMSPETFQQSLAWALVGTNQQKQAQEVERQKSKSGGKETVPLDYNWLQNEDF
tara:strand:- start:117 stop:395 length:279 start_codon:yes stop_codon:yes gene_type:complete